jgi:hypothetical protein
MYQLKINSLYVVYMSKINIQFDTSTKLIYINKGKKEG